MESTYFNTLQSEKILRYNDFNEQTQAMDDDEFLRLYRAELDKDITLNMLSNIPIFWQDYYGLFYLSLKFIKETYESNSKIISLGESPFKFLFAQSLFYEDPDIQKYMIDNNYPQNLSFMELPLSRLSKFTHNNTNTRVIRERGVDDILITLTETIDHLIPEFIKYFKHFNLDPKSIIENQDIKNFIFVDRGENFNTAICFIYIYAKMIEQFSPSDKNIFLSKLKLRTYDISSLFL
jgi:hypothetical protein